MYSIWFAIVVQAYDLHQIMDSCGVAVSGLGGEQQRGRLNPPSCCLAAFQLSMYTFTNRLRILIDWTLDSCPGTLLRIPRTPRSRPPTYDWNVFITVAVGVHPAGARYV